MAAEDEEGGDEEVYVSPQSRGDLIDEISASSQRHRRRSHVVRAVCARLMRLPRAVLAAGVLACVVLVLLVATQLGKAAQPLPAPHKAQRPVSDDDGAFDEDFERTIAHLRATQFPQLKNEVYLDYMGAGQYQKGQLDDYMKDITTHLYGNAREFCFDMTQHHAIDHEMTTR